MSRQMAVPTEEDAEYALGLLGLAARAGALVWGVGSVREEVRAGRVGFVFLGADAAGGQRGKLVPLLSARGIPTAEAFDRSVLGRAIGRPPVSAIGVRNGSFADRFHRTIGSM